MLLLLVLFGVVGVVVGSVTTNGTHPVATFFSPLLISISFVEGKGKGSTLDRTTKYKFNNFLNNLTHKHTNTQNTNTNTFYKVCRSSTVAVVVVVVVVVVVRIVLLSVRGELAVLTEVGDVVVSGVVVVVVVTEASVDVVVGGVVVGVVVGGVGVGGGVALYGELTKLSSVPSTLAVLSSTLGSSKGVERGSLGERLYFLSRLRLRMSCISSSGVRIWWVLSFTMWHCVVVDEERKRKGKEGRGREEKESKGKERRKQRSKRT